jgi:hypothetical protein
VLSEGLDLGSADERADVSLLAAFFLGFGVGVAGVVLFIGSVVKRGLEGK